MIMILGDMILSLTWLNLTTQRGLVLVSLLVTSFIVLSFLLSSSFISIPCVLSSFQCYQWTFYHSIDLFYCSVLLLCFVVLLFCCSVVLSCYCSVVPSFYHSTVLSCHHPRIHSPSSIRHLLPFPIRFKLCDSRNWSNSSDQCITSILNCEIGGVFASPAWWYWRMNVYQMMDRI